MKPLSRFKRLIEISVLSLAVAAIEGCGKPPQQQAPPPPAVTVSKPVQREVIEWDDFTGHLEAPESVTVSARVSGLIESMPFVEGSVVKKGQVLCTLDVRPFEADLDAAIGNQAKAKAQVDIAQSNFDREDQALKGNAVSQQDYDNAKATLEQNKAALESARATVESSRLNVEFCRVTSPIDGRVGNKMVTVGNLINGGTGQVTELTTIQSIDPMYCYVDVDENSVLKYQKLAAEQKMSSAREEKVPCFLRLANERMFSTEGYIDFVDNHVDPSTGTMRIRGVFANPSGNLTPGFFASMRIPGSGRYQTLLVPDQAIGTDQDRRYVLVVGPDGKATAHVVELGVLFGSLRSIISGIGPDDDVVVDGQMRVRPGMNVTPSTTTIKVNDADFAAGDPATTQKFPTTDTPATPDESAKTQGSSSHSSDAPTTAASTEPAQ
jgi:RND family efflux transporter MFP subunit